MLSGPLGAGPGWGVRAGVQFRVHRMKCRGARRRRVDVDQVVPHEAKGQLGRSLGERSEMGGVS